MANASTNPSALVQDLVRLGLEPSGAEIYVHLHMAGPNRASDIARALRINRGECYRALHRLVEQGLGRSTVGRPAVFSAVSPERLFNELSDHYQERGQRVRDSERTIRPLLEESAGLRPPTPSAAGLRTIMGRHEAYRAATQMLRGAKRSIRWIDAAEATGARDSQTRLWRLARQRAADGLSVRRIVGPDSHDFKAATPTLEMRRVENLAGMSVFIVDHAETLIGLVLEAEPGRPTDEDAYLASDAPALARTMTMLFDGLWTSQPMPAEAESSMVSPVPRPGSVKSSEERRYP